MGDRTRRVALAGEWEIGTVTNPGTKPVGKVVGFDLTVADADGVRDFYAAVVGWKPEGLDMGGYNDYFMMGAGGTFEAGVCHARGGNADLPPQWLAHVVVDDLDASLAKVVELGGSVVAGPKGEGNDRYCVIKDPAGAVISLRAAGAPEE
ncbi:VOC family protein [Actinokineospora sp.]|uniref:VOC family protein n=1 Tax=Actinokineospora sp. TaxID=1872133 RepID=UPI0040383306